MDLRPLASKALEATLTEFVQLENEIATLDEELKAKKARAKYLGENVMVEQVEPEMLTDGCRLRDGTEWTFKRDVKCGIPKDRKPEAFSWLAQKNADAMLKRYIVISFPKDSAKMVAAFKTMLARVLPQHQIGLRVGEAPDLLVDSVKVMLTEAGLLPVVTVDEEYELPGSTLSSFVKKQLALGQNLPECFGVYAPLRAYPVIPDVPEA